MSALRNATLVFLTKRHGGAVSEVCLALKKRGFGEGKWNGVGGKVEPHETIEQALVRETREEIGVEVKHFSKQAEISFFFLHNPVSNMKVHIYTCTIWDGEPKESEEMAPRWYKTHEIPYEKMWIDDPIWLPQILEGRSLKAVFTFSTDDVIKEKDVRLVKSLT